MGPLLEQPTAEDFRLGFDVSHQKVELDIDLRARSLKGRTEITINPHFKELKTLRLNCRQCELKNVTINGRPATGVTYEDVYKRAVLHCDATVHQFHLLQERIDRSSEGPGKKELLVTIPKNVRIDELDPATEEAQSILLAKGSGGKKREAGDVPIIELAQTTRLAVDENARFTPITLVVNYEIKHIRDGIHFVGWEEGDARYPHAYSTKDAARCLFPGLEELTARCTWEISIKCAKTIGDAFQRPSVQGQDSLAQSGTHRAPTGVSNGLSLDEAPQNLSDEDQALELVVVGPGDMTDEIVDSHDTTKKTTSFLCTNNLSARQIGFAIGPFEHVDLAEFRESDEDDRLGQRAVPVHGFCLPGRTEETKNTCMPLAKAIDFFIMNYGAYPFTNYKLCFIDDVYPDIVHTASLSICSNRLLFPEDIIEPLDRVTRRLVHAVASQWVGVDIVPNEPRDTWAVVGIAFYITDIYLKKLSGNNEYRYSHKRAADRVVELDVDRPSLLDTGSLVDLDPLELELMELKAPLILFILDRRLVKSGSSLGMSRIISRIFLNARTGDLPQVGLSTAYFVKTCEKVGHIILEAFFHQWVEGAGCPQFRVSQRFNKKKLVVEMSILQTQNEDTKDGDLDSNTFMRDVKEDSLAVYAGSLQTCFTGPMTIRIHEADGTPYEHIIEIKDVLTKFDVPYNTKYKRLKRSRRQKERTAAAIGMDYNGDGTDDVLLYSLGDVLQSEEEMKQWKLQDWSKEDEDRMSQESYEWIRMDADFEWICKTTLSMPGYMWVSQLQQDRDVVAQLESIQYLDSQKGHTLISTFLVRTLMDQRYFHGIRTAAASVLAKSAKEDTDWAGFFHLEKAFQELFCYDDSPMTRPNDFSDRTTYLVQCAIPEAIAKIRDSGGASPIKARHFLLEKLKFNDNSNNAFSDCHYLATMMRALADAMASKPAPNPQDDDMEDDNGDDLRFHNACLDEIDRYRRIDEWIPSYHNVLSTTALDSERMLAKAGMIKLKPSDLLQYTSDGTADDLRLSACANLMELGMARNDAVLRWLLFILGTDSSPYVRQNMIQIFGRTLGAIAIGTHASLTSPQEPSHQDNLVIEQEASTETRKASLARRQTRPGALQALKAELTNNQVLKTSLWDAITSPAISLDQLTDLLKICRLLYDPETRMLVTLKYPKYWKCTKVGKGQLRFYRSDRVRTTKIQKRLPPPPPLPPPPKPAPAAAAPVTINRTPSTYPFLKRDPSISTPAAAIARAPPAEKKLIFKPPKPPPSQMFSPPSSTRAPSGGGAPPPPSSTTTGEGKPKLKLKLKLGGGGGGAGGGGKNPP